MDYFWIIFNVLLIVALIYWMFRSYKSKKYNKILFVISVIVSVILIIPLLNGIVSNADSIIHPTPFLKLRSKNVHINGTHTKGVLYGETLSNSKVILKDADGIDDNIIVKSNGNGTFKATGLDDRTDYKVTAQKNGKKSDTLKISVGDIPESAYTKLHVNHSNSNNALIINNTDGNTITASGTSSPNAIIKFENPDDNYRVIKKITANNNGKWSVKLNGPGTGENDKKEIEYYIEAKISNRLTNNDGAIFIENTNHKKSNNNQNSESDNNLKAIISAPIDKSGYLTLEENLLESANVDDVNSVNSSTQAELRDFHNKANNILDKEKDAESLLSKNKSQLNSADQKKLKVYSESLSNYLSDLHDYAITYQNDNPVINNSETSEDTLKSTKVELNEAKKTFDKSKNNWSTQYDSIINN